MLKKDELENLVEKWLNRAALAYKQPNIELSKKALLHSWECQKQLAEMEGSKVPEQPQDPELFFRTWTPSQIHEAAEKALPDLREHIAQRAEWLRQYESLYGSVAESDKTQPDYPPDYFVKQARQALEQYLREKEHPKPETET